MSNEIIEEYRFHLNDYDPQGRHKDTGVSFRDLVSECERDFHERHTTSYAIFFYSNKQTMMLLQRSCNAHPSFSYGMDLYNGNEFDPINDPHANVNIDHFSSKIMVYGIDSAYMVENKIGVKVIDEDKGIYPLTLLIDNNMANNVFKLSCPDIDDGDSEEEPAPVVPDYKLVTV